MVYPCNEIQKTAWDVLKNFDHALILREDDPLLPAILNVYEETGIKDGTPQNTMKGEAFKTELATAYPDSRLVVTKETLTVEGMIKIVYDLLKDKLNIAKIAFTSGINVIFELGNLPPLPSSFFLPYSILKRCRILKNMIYFFNVIYKILLF